MRLYGEIKKGKIILNDAGIMINKWWNELECKYKNIELHEQIVMPNHLHGIIKKIINNPAGVGADLRVCPVKKNLTVRQEGNRVQWATI